MISPEYLAAKQAFYAEFAKKDPSHPHLAAIKDDIDQHERALKLAEIQPLIEHLKNDGYSVYELAGKSPAILRGESMRFWYVNPALEDVSAAPALVAFRHNPKDFFLRGSKDIPHDRMLELLEEEKHRVARVYPGADLIVREGKAPEWTELAWKHFKETPGKVRLFGRDYGYNYTWTDTYESDQVGAHRAIVGSWDEADGLHVFFDHPDDVDPSLRLAPLVEIHRK